MSVIRRSHAPLLLLLVGCFLTASGVLALAAPKEPGNPNAGCDESHHSDTGHGANQSGAYDSTCDGSPSGNGNGGGAASGKPCAGCVGNADDKNPPGQYPNGSDPNNGYECDGNSGVGQTNPAHTGCKTPTPPPAPTTAPPTKTPATTAPPSFPPGPPTTTPPFTPPGQASTPPGQASTPPLTPPGQLPTPTPPPGLTTPPPVSASPVVPPSVLPTVLTAPPENPGTPRQRPPGTGPSVAAQRPSQARGVLPFTGAGSALMLLAAGGLMTTGGGLMLVTGRPR